MPRSWDDFVAEMLAIKPGDEVELFPSSGALQLDGGIVLTVSGVDEDVIFTAPATGPGWNCGGAPADWTRNGQGVRVGSGQYAIHPFIRPVDDDTPKRVEIRLRDDLKRRIREADLDALKTPRLRHVLAVVASEDA